ncbi:Protein hook [Eumeta japonica]|uniref:Protein hook n=1 Tax=Eumeta variegata TaxID=151549 RepID=A0A4C1VN70_EUMVA|nr:Protein hook [Eumeta japonica]
MSRMEANGVLLCDNLIKWLQTLNLKARHETPSELSDGVAIAEALTQIAPEYFTPTWNSKIKVDVGTNWRLKVSNLKKILEGVVDYHQDILNLGLQEFGRPDVVNIAENADPTDLGRLLQLVLSDARTMCLPSLPANPTTESSDPLAGASESRCVDTGQCVANSCARSTTTRVALEV